MELNIPGSPFRINFGVSRRSGHPWGRFHLGGLLVLIALIALGLGVVSHWFRKPPEPPFAWTYPVGDLLGPRASLSVEFPELVATIDAAVAPRLPEAEPVLIVPFFLSQSLIVRASPAGHGRVQDWLLKERARRQTDEVVRLKSVGN